VHTATWHVSFVWVHTATWHVFFGWVHTATWHASFGQVRANLGLMVTIGESLRGFPLGNGK
jgi:hypothetical protein